MSKKSGFVEKLKSLVGKIQPVSGLLVFLMLIEKHSKLFLHRRNGPERPDLSKTKGKGGSIVTSLFSKMLHDALSVVG